MVKPYISWKYSTTDFIVELSSTGNLNKRTFNDQNTFTKLIKFKNYLEKTETDEYFV